MVLAEVIFRKGLAIGYAELRRMIGHNAIMINDKFAIHSNDTVFPGDIITYGKRKLVVDNDEMVS